MANLKNISKGRFLETLRCPLTGWRLRHQEIESIAEDDFFSRFLAEQGHIIGALSTEAWDEYLFSQGKPPGVDVDEVLEDRGITRADGDLWLQTAIEITDEALEDPEVWAIYEATVNIDNFTTRADILNKSIDKETGETYWEMIEVKSIVSLSLKAFPVSYMTSKKKKTKAPKDSRKKYVADMAYTVMVLRRAGIDVRRAGLLNVNKGYTDDSDENFMTVSWDFTAEAMAIYKGWEESGKWEEVETLTRSSTRPPPQFTPSCKRCPSCSGAIGAKDRNYITDIPNMGSRGMLELFQDLVNADIFCIEDIPNKFWGSDRSYPRRAGIVTECIKRGKTYVNIEEGFEIDKEARHGLFHLLSNNTIQWGQIPADNSQWVWYLDFEILSTAVPLWSDVHPYERVPVQYSVHGAAAEKRYMPNLYGPTFAMYHREFMARPEMDERIRMATQLTEDIGPYGSVFVYHAPVERSMIDYLMQLPGLSTDIVDKLDSIKRRLVDLLPMLRGGSVRTGLKSDCNFYDPRLKGSYSLKNVIKIFPHNPYESLDIAKGDAAAAEYGRLAYAFSYDNSPWTPEDFPEEVVEKILTGLRQYCAIDTLMLNWLHRTLVQFTHAISTEEGRKRFLATEDIRFAVPNVESCLDCGESYSSESRGLHSCGHVRERSKDCDLKGKIASQP